MISVVIPAHNAAATLQLVLHELVGDPEVRLDVVVVCNGCSDDTVGLAEAYCDQVTIVVIPQASKVGALNAGDRAARGWPRVYLDADVVLSARSVVRLAEVLEAGWCAAAPQREMDVTGSSWAVRAYYRVWERLPAVRGSLAGRGAYAMSRAGRARFDAFPPVTNDDGFVDRLFTSAEKTVVEVAALIQAPVSVRELLRRRARIVLGNAELRNPEQQPTVQTRLRDVLQLVRREPTLSPAAATYVAITLAGRVASRRPGVVRPDGSWG